MGSDRRRRGAMLAAALALGLASCGGDDQAAETTGPSAAPPATAAPATTAAEGAPATAPPVAAPAPLPGLPEDTAGYEGWTRLNTDPIPPDSAQTQRVGVDAHRGTKNVYVNQPRSALTTGSGERRLPHPAGTIIVKAAGDGRDPTLIAIMRKIAGADPAHGDWEFIEYKRSDAGEDFATSASLTGATCWSCHAVAEESDWVFTPLDPR